MPSGTTVNLKLLIQATNRASKTVDSLREQLNHVSKAAEELSKKSKKAGAEGSKAMQAFSKSTEGIANKLDKIGEAFKGAGAAGATLLGIAATLGTAVFFPVKSAADFQAEMSRVLAVTDGAIERFDELKNVASELGRTTKFTAQEAAAGMVFLGMAGLEAQEVIEGIGPALQLAAAAGIDLATSADIVTNVVSAMRVPMEDLGDAADILANTTASANTSLTQLADAMKYAAPLAAASGVELLDVASILGVLGNNGLQASMAGTAVRGMLRSLTSPTAAGKKVLEELNVQVRYNVDGSLDLVDALRQLGKAQLTTAQGNKLFGRFAAAGGLAVTAQIDALDKLILSNRKAAGSAKRMADVMLDNVKGAFVKLTSATDGLTRAFGDPLLEPLQKVLEVMTSMAGVATRLVETFPVLTATIGTLTGAVAALSAVIGVLYLALFGIGTTSKGLSKVFRNLPTTIGGVGTAFKKLWSIFTKNWFAIIAVAVGTLITLWAEWSNRNKVVIAQNKKLKSEMEGLYKNFEHTVEKIGQLKEGSDEYAASMLNLRAKLEEVAKNQKKLSVEATAAAQSINEETGMLNDGGKALDDYKKKLKALALDAMRDQLKGLNEELRIQRGEVWSVAAGWQYLKIGMAAFASLFGLVNFDKYLKELRKAQKQTEKAIEVAHKAYIRLLRDMEEFDMDSTREQVVAFFQVIENQSRETAEKIADSFVDMKLEADELKKIQDKVDSATTEELRKSLEGAAKKAVDLNNAYKEAQKISQEVSKQWTSLSEDQQLQEKELEKQVKRTSKAALAAKKELLLNDKELNLQIKKLREDRLKEAKDAVEKEVKENERNKKLEYITERQYDTKSAELKAKEHTAKVEALAEVINLIKKSGRLEISEAKKTQEQYEKELEKKKDSDAAYADEKIKQANRVADEIARINIRAAKQEAELLPDSPEKIRQLADLEFQMVKLQAKRKHVSAQQLAAAKVAIEKKAEREIAEFKRELAEAEEEQKVEAAKRTADRQLDLLEDAFKRGLIESDEYVERSVAAQTAVIDAEIAELEKKLQAFKDKYGEDVVLPVTLKLKGDIAGLEADKADLLADKPQVKKSARIEQLQRENEIERELIQDSISLGELRHESQADMLDREADLLHNQNEAKLLAMEEAGMAEADILKRAHEFSIMEKLAFAERERQIDLMRLSWASDNASRLSGIFADMYELGGKKQKGWLIASKAAAIAQVIISTQAAMMQALADPTIPSSIMKKIQAGLIAVQGAISIAKIGAASYAEGGEVKGKSPHKKADNIPIWATAKEWMMPVDTVSYYGKSVMEAMRKKLVPPELFSGYRVPVASRRSRRGFAEGGEVTAQGSPRSRRDQVVLSPPPPITIMNVIDPSEMDRYLSSAAGQNAILNVMSSRAEAVRRVIK